MQRYKVRLKRITYEGIKWNSFMISAENTEEAFRIVERDYRLHDCLDYWISIHSDIWMNQVE